MSGWWEQALEKARAFDAMFDDDNTAAAAWVHDERNRRETERRDERHQALTDAYLDPAGTHTRSTP